MRNNSAKQFDEQKNEVRRSVEVNQIAKKQLYHSSESMAAQLELMLKQTCEDNFKLHAYLEKAEKALESRELQTIGSEEFRQQVQKKLHELLRKFKNEAIKSDLMWLGEKNIQYAIDNFEATIETILQNRPCFHSLAKRLEVLMEVMIKKKTMRFVCFVIDYYQF